MAAFIMLFINISISLKLIVAFAVLNYISLSFMQIHTVFFVNDAIYCNLLIFCCQNVAVNTTHSKQAMSPMNLFFSE